MPSRPILCSGPADRPRFVSGVFLCAAARPGPSPRPCRVEGEDDAECDQTDDDSRRFVGAGLQSDGNPGGEGSQQEAIQVAVAPSGVPPRAS